LVAVLTPDIGDVQAAKAIAGAEALFSENGYGVLVTSGQSSGNRFAHLRQRGVEGAILIEETLGLPDGFPHVFLHLTNPDRLRDEGRTAAHSLLMQIEQRKNTRDVMQSPDLHGQSLNSLCVS
jgi:hypothetical protein